MKRNAIAAICAAVVAAAIVVPVALQGAPAAGTQVQDEAPVASATAVSAADDGPTYEQDAILVNVRDGATAADLNAQLAGLDYIATKQVADDDIASGYVKLELASGTDVKDAEARIADDAAEVVAGSQPNYYYHLLDDAPASGLIASIIAQTTAIDDPRAEKQWALDAVNAREAWDTAQVNRAVTVAVIDNGCLTTHEDLASNIRATYNAVEGGTDVTPKFGAHGTHVCGIIAAETNNAKGVAGVSYNAGLLPIQVFESTADGSTASSLTLIKAFSYIRRMASTYNIKVVNMSVGGTYVDDELDEGDDGLISAIESAYDAGILTVCSAGNDASTVLEGSTEPLGAYLNFPSDWVDCALGVIASTKAGERASYSNYNMTSQTTKDITAPGSEILSTIAGTSSYGSMSGTSMAAPCVAGIAALVYSVNSGFSAAKVSEIICETAQDLGAAGWDEEHGFGLVDAQAAVEYAKKLTGSDSSSSAAKPVVSNATATITLSQSVYTYDGTAKQPGVTVRVGGATLSQGVDYTVAYSDNMNAGTATVKIVAKGDYLGAATSAFTIAPAPIASLKLSATSFKYSGSAKAPAVTVRGVKGGKAGQVLAKGVDYSLRLSSGRKAVGTYSVVVTGVGNYSGTKTASFTIVPAGTTIGKLTAVSKGFTARWGKRTAQTSGYQLQYGLKSSFKSAKTVTVKSVKTVSKKVTKLKAKRKYYVRVRTYKVVGGKTYYSAWSGKKAVTTKR